ncbi:Fatty acid desaturase [Botrimarina colliarenosi]|uniref:Fatty acid desaturase n=1 Tax=Botrimarina colliarenosi TaxID=2528001 RepID=A0A5C6A656_9BACT|nr:fatty acid desaturase [Botrimarina colliarenosi]TWT94855.1 Fatty acid desaturase [Botrimarina colliarenosi]
MREARSLLREDDLRPQLWRYWVDLLSSWVGLIAGIQLMQAGALPWPARAAAFAMAVILGYRCALFTHEIAHQPEKNFRAFRFVWNLLIGIPFLMPSFTYSTHLDHHRRRSYGTSHDGEYLPFGSRPVWHLLGYLAESFIIPILAIVRFGVMTPLTWLGQPFRDWVHRHASSMIIDPAYVRPLPSDRQLRNIRMQEIACFGFLVIASFMIVRSWMGVGILDPWLLPHVYAVAVTILFVNSVRTLGAHRYYYDRRAANDEPMSFTEQLLDSINYPHRPWLTTLWAPVGLQYHALHHLFPSMPYHAMPKAHRRLMEGLPADSPYRLTESPGLPQALANLWRRARQSGQDTAPSSFTETVSPRGDVRHDAPTSGPITTPSRRHATSYSAAPPPSRRSSAKGRSSQESS